jgi:Icc-related predicted phosphoesterase
LNCIFATDIHGLSERYLKLFKIIEEERPDAVFLGGDILPSGWFMKYETYDIPGDFIDDFLAVKFAELKDKLGESYPRIFVILGNDDGRIFEQDFIKGTEKGLWEYINLKQASLDDYHVYGYCFVSPTPFRLKDWEKYDVSRFVDPGCLSPEEGVTTIELPDREKKNTTIKSDLDELTKDKNLEKSMFLFHTPPYQTKLDRAALDGKMIDHVPMDVNIGSIAVRRFIESRQPLLTLHGHVHESTRLTGSWKDKIGRTVMFSAAHDGRELCIVRFDPENLDKAERELI